MSTPNDDLPLDNRTGNLYDPLFAQRIEALGKSSAKPPAPNRPNGNGAGWPVGILIVMIIACFRGCTSVSTPNHRSIYDSKLTDSRELRERLHQNLPRLEPVDEPPKGEVVPAPVDEKTRRAFQEEFNNHPILGARRQIPEEKLRKLRELLKRIEEQQAGPPVAPDQPGPGP